MAQANTHDLPEINNLLESTRLIFIEGEPANPTNHANMLKLLHSLFYTNLCRNILPSYLESNYFIFRRGWHRVEAENDIYIELCHFKIYAVQ